MVPAAVLVPCMVNFAFLHGSVPLCSTYRSGLGVPPGPSGKQLLSSWEDISLDIKVAQNVSWCVVGCPHSLQATDTYRLWRSNKNYSHKPLRFFFFHLTFSRASIKPVKISVTTNAWARRSQCGRLGSTDQTQADPLPGSSPAPKYAFDWEKEGRQDFQQQLCFQAVNGLDVLVPRGPGMEAQLNQLTNLWRNLSPKWKIPVSFNQLISAA